VEAYDAGWLVDPADQEALDGVLDAILGHPGAGGGQGGQCPAALAEALDPG